jgi:hypothetical protein
VIVATDSSKVASKNILRLFTGLSHIASHLGAQGQVQDLLASDDQQRLSTLMVANEGAVRDLAAVMEITDKVPQDWSEVRWWW